MDNFITLTDKNNKTLKIKAVAIDGIGADPANPSKSVIYLRGGQVIGVSESLGTIELRIKEALK